MMKRWSPRMRLMGIAVVSFMSGFVSHFVATFDIHGNEPRVHEYEALKQEAAGFFYPTMQELFTGTYDPQKGHVSAQALSTFSAYKSRLEPRCWLANIYLQYGTIYGDVFFPSGDVFEVRLLKGRGKTGTAWTLDDLCHKDGISMEQFYHDLRN